MKGTDIEDTNTTKLFCLKFWLRNHMIRLNYCLSQGFYQLRKHKTHLIQKCSNCVMRSSWSATTLDTLLLVLSSPQCRSWCLCGVCIWRQYLAFVFDAMRGLGRYREGKRSRTETCVRDYLGVAQLIFIFLQSNQSPFYLPCKIWGVNFCLVQKIVSSVKFFFVQVAYNFLHAAKMHFMKL